MNPNPNPSPFDNLISNMEQYLLQLKLADAGTRICSKCGEDKSLVVLRQPDKPGCWWFRVDHKSRWVMLCGVDEELIRQFKQDDCTNQQWVYCPTPDEMNV